MAFPGSFRAFVFILAFFPALRLEAADAARLYRDAYGVPHVFADSMAAAYYGGGYAMGEDLGYHASQLALAMEGRKAELLDGSSANIRDDIEARLFRFYATARERFGELSPEVQLALRSFAAGLARAYAENPAPRPGWAIDVTAEHLAASFLAANFYQSAFEASAHELKDIGAQLRYPYLGSNAWAAAAARTADGGAMHFAGPQTPFGQAQAECHLEWPGGRIAGYGQSYGLFVDPGLGLNHAWGSTANWPDTSDVYELRLDPARPDYYWDGAAAGGLGDWAPLEVVEIDVMAKGRGVASASRFRSPLGPILRIATSRADGSSVAYAWRASGDGRIEYIEEAFRKQWAASARAALGGDRPPEAVSGNRVLADSSGTIAFLYNARVFERRTRLGGHAVRSAEDRQSAWEPWAYAPFGPHPLPLAINPLCGFVTSNNEAPWLAAPSGEIAGRDAWPPYLVPDFGWGSAATTRGERAREILGGSAPITLETAMQLAFDTAVPKAKAWIAAYRAAWLAAGEARPRLSPDGRALHGILAEWNGRADADSPGMTAAFYFIRQWAPWPDPAEAARADAAPAPSELTPGGYAETIDAAARILRSRYGKLLVPWGEIHGIFANGQWRPLGGGTEFLPAIFQAHMGVSAGGDAISGDNRIHCSSGSAHMALTAFRPGAIERYTINPAGQHNPKIHPDSPHCSDQTALYASGRFKRFWLTEAEVAANPTPYEGTPGYPLRALRILEIPAELSQDSSGAAETQTAVPR